jgi:hypothetical protein
MPTYATPIFERAVGREGDADAERHRVLGEVEDVGADERLAAGDEQRRTVDAREIANHRLRFFGGELAFEPPRLRVGVAVDAFEIAGFGRVPDDDRTPALPRAGRLRRRLRVIPKAIAEVRGTAEKFRYADHQILRIGIIGRHQTASRDAANLSM